MLELAPDPEVIEAALHHKFLPYAAFARYDVSNETLRRWLRGEFPPTVLVRRLADCRALKKPQIRLLLRRWARKTSPTRRCALLAACALLHGDSEHVAGKAALRLLESQRLIPPAGGARSVNITNFGHGAGYFVDERRRIELGWTMSQPR